MKLKTILTALTFSFLMFGCAKDGAQTPAELKSPTNDVDRYSYNPAAHCYGYLQFSM